MGYPDRQGRATQDDTAFVAGPLRLDTETIFREMIAQELRAGRLTRPARRRIVRYAAQLGLSAVDAGRMIDQCRDNALQSDDPNVRRHALRLVPPTRPPRQLDVQGITVIAVVMILELMLIGWFAG